MRYLPNLYRLCLLALLPGLSPGFAFATEPSLPLLFEKPRLDEPAAPPSQQRLSGSVVSTVAVRARAPSVTASGTPDSPAAVALGTDSRIGTADRPIFIRVMVNYTQAVLDAHPFINDFVDLLIAETNQGFFNSNVFIKLDLSAQRKVTYKESGNVTTDLDNYTGRKDGHMDEIHAARDAGHADINVLLINTKKNSGQAYINAIESTAFAVVSEEGASGGYVFGHEIGHLFGARHDQANDPLQDPYPYGHGYQSGRWRTIMAYECRFGSCPPVNYWSNPDIRYQGIPMGHPRVSDNHRVLNERAATVAAFRADSEPPR